LGSAADIFANGLQGVPKSDTREKAANLYQEASDVAAEAGLMKYVVKYSEMADKLGAVVDAEGEEREKEEHDHTHEAVHEQKQHEGDGSDKNAIRSSASTLERLIKAANRCKMCWIEINTTKGNTIVVEIGHHGKAALVLDRPQHFRRTDSFELSDHKINVRQLVQTIQGRRGAEK